MVIECSRCKKPAITFIRYNGTHLCKNHFIDYFDKRVKKDLKKQGKITDKTKFAVAISGGKDSAVALYMTHKIFSKRKDVEIISISVDEGIKGYRDESLVYAKKISKKLDVAHFIVSFKDMIGISMDEISKRSSDLGECSYCGVFRRFCLNEKSKELRVNKLITGHNLDDMAQSILMNFSNADIKKLARLGPHKKIQPGLIPRIMPLRTIPEKENALYAVLNNIEFDISKCPYSVNASRGDYRDIIDDLEDKYPGTRHSILNSYDSIKDVLMKKFPPANLKKCKICGEPTSQQYCKVCLLKKKVER